MSVELVTSTFEGRIGETFRATPNFSGEPLELELTSCVRSLHATPEHPAFSLFFDSPDPERREQQIFTLEHDELGPFDLFLVPVGPQQYEAVVN
jgi:hypothetical protein